MIERDSRDIDRQREKDLKRTLKMIEKMTVTARGRKREDEQASDSSTTYNDPEDT